MGKSAVFFRTLVFLVLLISISSIVLDFSAQGFTSAACLQELDASHPAEDTLGSHDHGEDHLVLPSMNLPAVIRSVALAPVHAKPGGATYSTRPQLPPPDPSFQTG